ncbi:hypothetical protein [Aquabacterium sp. CECT 9606]|uniref:hypothetical protein n=1 Tax=Aquabacterium sp. CECT 9606 TaxID=2845822 RepID=UPI001E4341B3|nr:hypothetical protein [Aquabacterium sp. CECT 9606]CAH0354065.1 hypothetical protein AQB9606_03457 [Aquabacterium sp. CECT 9606]
MSKPKQRKDSGRDAGGFIALPWSVMDCQAYQSLSMHARALLLEVARQYVRDNNGRLLLSRAFMADRGWKSADMLTKAKRELLDGGFIFETVKGHRPHKASWYAITWQLLDRHPGFDPGAFEAFRKGAYQPSLTVPSKPKPTRDQLYRKWDQPKNAVLIPPHGTGGPQIGPPHGTGPSPTVPPHGPIAHLFTPSSVPPHGHHLEMPSKALAA